MLQSLQEASSVAQQDSFFYDEMMAHSAVFTFQQPKRIAILGEYAGILQEVLKHPYVDLITCVSEKNPGTNHITGERVKLINATPPTWLAQCAAGSFDIIIQNFPEEKITPTFLQHYFNALSAEGILAQPSLTSLLHFPAIKATFQQLQQTGFNECQVLNFFQPSYPTGLRTLLLATKRPVFKRLRESDIYNRNFSTRYYNFDTHKAALALPEFMREEIEEC